MSQNKQKQTPLNQVIKVTQMKKSCATCRWVACRNFGWEDRKTCSHFINQDA